MSLKTLQKTLCFFFQNQPNITCFQALVLLERIQLLYQTQDSFRKKSNLLSNRFRKEVTWPTNVLVSSEALVRIPKLPVKF